MSLSLLECAAWLKCVSINDTVDETSIDKRTWTNMNLTDGVFKAKVVYFLFLFPFMNLQRTETRRTDVDLFDLVRLLGGGLNASSKPSSPIPSSEPHWLTSSLPLLYLNLSCCRGHLMTQSPLKLEIYRKLTWWNTIYKVKKKKKLKKTNKKKNHRNDPKAFSTLSGNLFQERSVNI